MITNTNTSRMQFLFPTDSLQRAIVLRKLAHAAMRYARSWFLTTATLGIVLGLSACQSVPQPANFSLKKFADALQANLKGNSVGYEFTVGYQSQWIDMRSGGQARTMDDPPAEAMSPFVKFSVASVSKNITAAAALQVLDARHISLDTSIAPYLPTGWKPEGHIAALTFRELLMHTSGIVTPHDVDYQSLKNLVTNPVLCDPGYVPPAKGPADCDLIRAPGTGRYNNSNYALFRFLIPNLAQMKIPADPPYSQLGTGYGLAYVSYVQKHVFLPISVGLAKLTCTPDKNTGVSYHNPPTPGLSGLSFGDMTARCGSEGWVMSSVDLDDYFRNVMYTSLVPYTKWLGKTQAADGARNNPGLGELMRQSCIGFAQQACGNTVAGTTYKFWSHGGYYPDNINAGEFNSALVVFSNGVNVALIVNSPLHYDNDRPIQAVLDAFITATK